MQEFRVSGSIFPQQTPRPRNETAHNNTGVVRVPVRKYKIITNIEIMPAVFVGFGIHRMDVGIMTSDGVIIADTLFYFDVINKISLIDIALMIFTEGVGNVIKTVKDYLDKVEKVRALMKFLSDNVKNKKPDISDWDRGWKEFKRAKFQKPSELIGIGKSVGWDFRVSVLGALTLGFGWNGFKFYGGEGGVKLFLPDLAHKLDLVASLTMPTIVNPGNAEPIAEIGDWSFTCKSWLIQQLKIAQDREGTLLDYELSDYIGDLGRSQGTGVWCSVNQAATFIANYLIPWIETISKFIENNFQDLIECLANLRLAISLDGYYHIIRTQKERVTITHQDPLEGADGTYRKIFTPSGKLIMK